MLYLQIFETGAMVLMMYGTAEKLLIFVCVREWCHW